MAREIERFTLVEATVKENLIRDVNMLIEKGFVPFGDTHLTIAGFHPASGQARTIYTQSMVKYEDKP